jgi:hypothetical protein
MLGRILFFTLLIAPVSATAQTVYFGNLHAHTSYSDGSGTPEEAYRMARKADMDFLALTEHNHSAADGKGPRKDGLLIATKPVLYSGKPSSLIETANRLTEPGAFVAIYGQEFSTISKGNHANIFDVPTVIRVPDGDFSGLRTWIAANPDSSGGAPLVQFNHPRNAERFPADYGHDDFPDVQSWVAALDPVVELIEVLNAPALKDGTGFRAKSSESYYFTYLNLGFHLAPSVGHDNHFRNWGFSTDARVAVLADGLTRPDLLKALKQRHAYATEDKNLRIVFRANGALSGDIVRPPAEGSELDLTVLISDDDDPDAS